MAVDGVEDVEAGRLKTGAGSISGFRSDFSRMPRLMKQSIISWR